MLNLKKLSFMALAGLIAMPVVNAQNNNANRWSRDMFGGGGWESMLRNFQPMVNDTLSQVEMSKSVDPEHITELSVLNAKHRELVEEKVDIIKTLEAKPEIKVLKADVVKAVQDYFAALNQNPGYIALKDKVAASRETANSIPRPTNRSGWGDYMKQRRESQAEVRKLNEEMAALAETDPTLKSLKEKRVAKLEAYKNALSAAVDGHARYGAIQTEIASLKLVIDQLRKDSRDTAAKTFRRSMNQSSGMPANNDMMQ